jgi:hypothetical protein
MINWATLRTLTYDWLTSTGLQAVWSDQVNPKPPRPYVSMKITPISRPDFSETRLGSVSGSLVSVVQKEIAINVQIIGDVSAAGQSRHLEEADKLIDKLYSNSIGQLFQVANFSLIDTSPVIDTTEYLDTNYEPKAVFDARLYAMSETTELVLPTNLGNGATIQSAEIESNLIETFIVQGN